MEAKPTDSTGRQIKSHLVRGLVAALKECGASDSPAGIAEALLADAVRERATDIHFEPQRQGVLVRLRIDGHLYDTLLLTTHEGTHAVRHFEAIAGMDSSQHFMPADARIASRVDGREIDLRVASAPCLGGEALTLRLLDPRRAEQRLGQLGLSEANQCQLETWLADGYGMFLAVGPGGSGKTTTLYALLHELRANDRAVFTIEDPVEYRMDGISQMQVDQHRGLTFASGLHAMLRLDPDHLFLGEIRDAQAARAAAEAASGGRVLMSTISGVDAVGTVSTLRALGLTDREIAAGLQCVVAQRLVRRLCPLCCVRATEDVAFAREAVDASGDEHWEAGGCEECRGLGYIGRTGVFEVWRLDAEDRTLIQSHADEQTIRDRLLDQGFSTLVDDAVQKVQQRLTSGSEVRRLAGNYPGENHVATVRSEASVVH